MSEFYIDDIPEMGAMLNEGKLILAPEDCGWSVLADVSSLNKVEDLIQASVADGITILVDHPERFKDVIPNLHPRIETLLTLHRQPLGIVFNNQECLMELNDRDPVVVRMVLSPYLKQVIGASGGPLIAVRPYSGDQPTFSKDEVEQEVLDRVDFISEYHPKTLTLALPVLAEYNKKAVLDFIRE